MGEVPEVSAAMEIVLAAEGYRVRQLVAGKTARAASDTIVEADFSSAQSLEDAHRLILGSTSEPVGAVINLLSLESQFRQRQGTPADDEAALRLATATFNIVKQFADDLVRSTAAGGGWLINFTSLNGKFGVGATGAYPLAQAGTLGVMKAAAKELSGVRVKNIDLDPSVDQQSLFTGVTAELTADDPAIEVGFGPEGRTTLELHETTAVVDEPLDLDENSVVLVTGGAYGITADACKALARQYSPRLILVGRSPLPADEPAELAELQSPTRLRQHLIATMRRADPSVTPAQIEQALRQILKSRQIRQNLNEMRQLGSTVEYHALDVRSADQFGRLLDDVYARLGRIDGAIHGAGVIDDHFIRDKTPESFAGVFTTKVNSAMTLARKLRPSSLKFLVFFSSVSGRFGNIGQADYSAANEYLNKLAQQLDQSWPGRVVAINWGPWDAGMVSDQLREIYRSRDIDLIPPAEGVRLLLAELARRGPAAPEVIITCSARQIEQIRL